MAGGLKYIRNRYGVPAYQNDAIVYTRSDGTRGRALIKSVRQGKLRVWPTNCGTNVRILLHPTDNIDYVCRMEASK